MLNNYNQHSIGCTAAGSKATTYGVSDGIQSTGLPYSLFPNLEVGNVGVRSAHESVAQA